MDSPGATKSAGSWHDAVTLDADVDFNIVFLVVFVNKGCNEAVIKSLGEEIQASGEEEEDEEEEEEEEEEENEEEEKKNTRLME